MTLELRVLKAEHGDSIVISGHFDGEYRNILIDGGPAQVFESQRAPRPLQFFLNDVKRSENKIDLLILTHVDDDHIGGLLAGFNKKGYLTELAQEVWFNSGELIFNHFEQQIDDSNFVMLKNSKGGNTSTNQGVRLENYLTGRTNLANEKMWSHPLIKAGDEIERFGCKFKILSPTLPKLQKLLIQWEKDCAKSNTSGVTNDYETTLEQLLTEDTFKEDIKPHNGSSLAFIFEFQNKAVLFLGDSHPSIIIASLEALGFSTANRLKIDYMKVSHHGSKSNTSDELLSLIDCENFIISANGRHHCLPNKKTLARIINRFPNARLMFNYPDLIAKIFDKEELESVTFEVIKCEDVITL
jgi:beta-lactamase superfamily II metal-dependent hydrolase